MRRRTIYLICAALALSSCCKDKKVGDDGFKDDAIGFAPMEAAATKAMMDDAALKTDGNKIRVFDILDGFSGTVSWMSENNPYYINDEIVYSGSTVWDYVSGRKYPWTADGSHLFFGYLSYDTTLSLTPESFFGNGFSYNTSTQVLSIPTKEMNTSTAQFDFMYSNAEYVDAANHVAGQPVNLTMNHLFSALKLTLNNTSENTIYLKSVTLKGMKNVRSASVAFDAHNPTVSTANLASTDVVLYQSANEGGTEFVYVDQEKPLSADYILMWPQTFAELAGAELEVVYYSLSGEQMSSELTSHILLNKQNLFRIGEKGMDAGSKYTFQLQFKKSTIDVYIKVLPWEYDEFDWNYADRAITARSGMFKDGVLAFYRYDSQTDDWTVQPTTDEWSAKAMRFTTRNEVLKGKFYIESPWQGRWQIIASPISAAQYFVITPTSGDIDVNTDNGKCEFSVSVNPNLSPATTQNLYFSVQLFFNGEWHDANSEFNRKNIRLVLDAN